MSALKQALFYIGYYLGLVLCAAGLWSRPWLLTGIFFAASLLLLWRWFSLQSLMFYGIAFILGPLGEVIAVSGGAWHYSGATRPIPYWLPFAWGLTVLFILRVSELLSRLHLTSEGR